MVRIIIEPSILLSFYIYCYCINLVPFLFISVMLSTFPFPLKPHSELLVDCYYPVLYQLMEPTCKEEDVNQSHMWDWPCRLIFLFSKAFTEEWFLIMRWSGWERENTCLTETFSFRKGPIHMSFFLMEVESDLFDAFWFFLF